MATAGGRAEWASERSGNLRGVRAAARRAIVATAAAAARIAASVSAAADPPPGTWGPYYRTGSTQDEATTRKQLASGELWGRANRGSDTPSVDAWDGPLPADRHGIEFYTDVPPSTGSPPHRARWLGPRQGVSISGGWAKIRVTITKTRFEQP
jgi:hypothetical protein